MSTDTKTNQDPDIPQVLDERGEEIFERLSEVLAEYDLEGYELHEIKLNREKPKDKPKDKPKPEKPSVEFICLGCCPLYIYPC